MSEHLKVKLEGDILRHGRIPVNLLSKILKSVQTAMYSIGEMEHLPGNSVRFGGSVSKKIRDGYTLELIGTTKGSFVAELDLPANVSGSDQHKTFDLFYEIMSVVSSSEPDRITKVIPDRATRNRVTNSIIDMLPANDEYTISFAQGRKTYTSPITTSAKKEIRRLLSRRVEEVREVIGRIVELKILGDSHIGVYQNSKIIKCTTSDNENEAFQSIGKEVILKGEALLNDNGTIKELVSVQDVFIAEPGALQIDQFWFNDISYEMCDGFSVELDYIQDYWVIEQKDLDIYVSESTFSEAMESLYGEIEFLYEEYGKAPDEDLTADAIELKENVNRYVERVVALQ